MDGQRENLAGTAEGRRLSDQQQQAFSILTSGKMAQAFDLERQPVAARDRYGRHAFGQSLLLARRLVQAGVPVVQVNMGSAIIWDTHGNNFGTTQEHFCRPGPGRGRSARRPGGGSGCLATRWCWRLASSAARRKIASGKTLAPAVSTGRACFFGLFAGGGVRGGQVIGKSDRTAPIRSPRPIHPTMWARRFITSSASIPRRRCATASAGRFSSTVAR